MLEVFCKQAGLVTSCMELNVHSCGVGLNSYSLSSSPCIGLDLLLPWAQAFVEQLVSCEASETIVWFSAPCGSFSRARERNGAAIPLRSARFTLGRPEALEDSLTAKRLRHDNALALYMFKLINVCIERNIRWFVCSAASSYLWELREWRSLACHDFSFSGCAYGSGRPNVHRVRGSDDSLVHLAAKCPGCRAHKPWTWAGDFGSEKSKTAKAELAPPKEFWKAVANSLHRSFTSSLGPVNGMAATAVAMSKTGLSLVDENKTRCALLSSSAGWQARGRRLEQVIAEYRDVQTVLLPAALLGNLQPRQRIKAPINHGEVQIPAESQLIEVTGGDNVSDPVTAKFGIPWSMAQFLQRALCLEHPFSFAHCPDSTVLAVFRNLTCGPKAVAEHRAACFARWSKLADSLKVEEELLCASLHPDVAKFALKKRPLLTLALLKEAKFPAADLVYEFLLNGWPMFGDFPSTKVFPARLHERTQTKQELMPTAKWAVHSLVGSKPFDTPPEVASALRAATDDELERGECRGPFSKEEMDKRYPDGWIPGVRFAVCQKGGVRACDHYSKYGQNGVGETPETVDTEGQDAIVSVARLWSSSVDANRKVRMRQSDGTVLEGELHESLSLDDLLKLMARIIDLARAYKQLARRPDDADLAIFAQFGENELWEFYEALVLGFGARDAVFSFNLMARALRHLLNHLLWVPATHFYDDFSQVEPEKFSLDSCAATQQLFDLLGWDYKRREDQLKPPASSFSPLGVFMDFAEPGIVAVGNTEKRRERIRDEIANLCALPSIQPAPLVSLIGVCSFAESQTCGRVGAMILKDVRVAARASGVEAAQRLKSSLRALAEFFHAAKPRRVRISSPLPPVIVLTDAAFESTNASIGGVIVDPTQNLYEFFGKRIGRDLVRKWQGKTKTQVICQAELIAIPVALTTWKDALRNRDVILFIDNDPAREALIRGSSVSSESSCYVHGSRLLCAEAAIAPWYARVASPSNIADLPSRGHFTSLLAAGATLRDPSLITCEADLVLLDF